MGFAERKAPAHPYEREAGEAGMVGNLLGQRLTGLIPLGPDLFVSTGSKSGQTIQPGRLPFLNEQQQREYGAVYRLRMPRNLAAVMRWKDQPTILRFMAGNGRMSIEQDGEVIGSAEVDDALLRTVTDVNVNWGEGIFGPLQGKLLQSHAE